MLTAHGVRCLRMVAAIIPSVAGVVLLIAQVDPVALAVSLIVFGVFVFGHRWLDYKFQALRSMAAPASDQTGLRDFAATLVGTSGVILGLLAVFGKQPFDLTIRFGIAALVAGILIAIVLVGLLLAGADPADLPPNNLIVVVFNFALWGLSFGLVCIAIALISGA
jgi:hypothetical protein